MKRQAALRRGVVPNSDSAFLCENPCAPLRFRFCFELNRREQTEEFAEDAEKIRVRNTTRRLPSLGRQQSANRQQNAEVIRAVIGDQQSLAQHSLAAAVRNLRE